MQKEQIQKKESLVVQSSKYFFKHSRAEEAAFNTSLSKIIKIEVKHLFQKKKSVSKVSKVSTFKSKI
jgi:ERCC4-type nuclease